MEDWLERFTKLKKFKWFQFTVISCSRFIGSFVLELIHQSDGEYNIGDEVASFKINQLLELGKGPGIEKFSTKPSQYLGKHGIMEAGPDKGMQNNIKP